MMIKERATVFQSTDIFPMFSCLLPKHTNNETPNAKGVLPNYDIRETYLNLYSLVAHPADHVVSAESAASLSLHNPFSRR